MASNNTLVVQPKRGASAQRTNVRMVQNVRLIWLDANIDEGNTDCQNTITRLRQAMNTINTYTDGDQCIQFLEQIQDDKVCMVISGALGKHIVPCVHEMSQVDSIFIFCGNKQYHEQWTKDWSKVKGVYTDITLICDALKQSVKDCEQNAIGFSTVATSADSSSMNLDRLDPMFMYTQITKEILLVIEFEQQHLLDFTKYCREVLENNGQELNNVNKFEKRYRKKAPIYWYTWKSFLYPMLNRALPLSDINVIVKMEFFIRNLHQQIEELHREQFTGSNTGKRFVVFRGQGMSKDEFEKISKTKGDLIAFNNLLSTSGTELVSMDFAKRALSNPELVGVLFEMQVDPKQSTTPFASVAEVCACANNEAEILFAMHTVFRIRDIQPMDGNPRLFRVTLKLTSDNDEELQVLTKQIRDETLPDKKGWNRLALVLRKLGKPKQAEEIYRILFEQESDESNMGYYYKGLGSCKQGQGEYDEVIPFYEKAIAIDEKYHPNSRNLANSYNDIALVYKNMGEYAKALSSLEKALAIRQQSLPPTHPHLASTYNNIGNVYGNMGEYARALSHYEKALALKQQSLSPSHPDLAASYYNIGLVYENMKNYCRASSFIEKTIEIAEQSLPPNHPKQKMCKNTLDRVKNKL